MLRKILIGLIVVIAAVVGGAFLLPDTTRVARSIEIAAPPAKIYGILSTLKRGNEWSPWAELDPKMQQTFSGPDQGVGAKMSWKSDNGQVGSGTQEIVAATPDKSLDVKLTMEGMGESMAGFDLAPAGAGTKVTWRFDTSPTRNPVARYMGLMLDSMLGPDFEKGLAKLKTVAEKP